MDKQEYMDEQELLDKLNILKDKLMSLISLREEQLYTVSQYRQKISILANKKYLPLLIINIVASSVLLIYGIASRNLLEPIILIAIGILLTIKKGNIINSNNFFIRKINLFAKIYRILYPLYAIFSLISYSSKSFIFLIATVIFCIIEVIVLKILINVFNKSAEEKNKPLYDNYNKISEMISEQASDIKEFIDGNWFPEDYCSMHAVEFFIYSLKNKKADTIKELVNLYDTHGYSEQMVNSQKEIIRNQDIIIDNQYEQIRNIREIKGELRTANVLNVANFALNAANNRLLQESNAIGRSNSRILNSINNNLR
ncbi:hypothetical protein HMPREF1143_0511 [Peptoanaerobacter stomatis]|uniref:Uncharacterized protein n=2 Tax=Peptoanaerobacter stomatis TaxID=796937 RepID=J4W3D6_9FIRM|nr:hypothetical protein HMPREF1143_0511 [Peptoanaerobacter stomatis]NWO25571.1 hypothetical protein [Peptostreptococcaceae bacterium oral taxon 081]